MFIIDSALEIFLNVARRMQLSDLNFDLCASDEIFYAATSDICQKMVPRERISRAPTVSTMVQLLLAEAYPLEVKHMVEGMDVLNLYVMITCMIYHIISMDKLTLIFRPKHDSPRLLASEVRCPIDSRSATRRLSMEGCMGCQGSKYHSRQMETARNVKTQPRIVVALGGFSGCRACAKYRDSGFNLPRNRNRGHDPCKPAAATF
jgi:hypothetical protein